jgi:hypothetical protein
VLRVFRPEAGEERISVLRPQGWRKGDDRFFETVLDVSDHITFFKNFS